MPNIVYFDLETQKSFSDVGGFSQKHKMGVSVGVTYSTATGQYTIYQESEMQALVQELTRADLVVGFNHIGFDYGVLQAYTVFDLLEQTQNLDMLVDVEKTLGHRLKLDSIASASLGMGKTADGLDALKWWQEYKRTGDPAPLLKIAEYCCYDVKVTKLVHEYGVANGYVKFADRNGHEQQCAVDWKMPG
jgi:DEAD/DEAH box helicase domain-containing protein